MLIALMILLAQAVFPPPSQRPFEITTALMHSTFYLQGPSTEAGKVTTGSGLVVGRPCGDSAPGRAAYTLVTAAHVLDQVAGDTLLILLRLKQPDDTWQKAPHFVKIRDQGANRWVKHPGADVAALYVALPEGAVPQLLPIDFFATDRMLEQFEVHPGDEVLALGYPLGVAANESGFPLLRSGRIASFPLLPQARTRTFRVDMDSFPGNSGGPVYFWDRNRSYQGTTHIGEVRFLMGIITGTVFAQDSAATRLRIAEAVHANFVLEAISMLPLPDCSK